MKVFSPSIVQFINYSFTHQYIVELNGKQILYYGAFILFRFVNDKISNIYFIFSIQFSHGSKESRQKCRWKYDIKQIYLVVNFSLLLYIHYIYNVGSLALETFNLLTLLCFIGNISVPWFLFSFPIGLNSIHRSIHKVTIKDTYFTFFYLIEIGSSLKL